MYELYELTLQDAKNPAALKKFLNEAKGVVACTMPVHKKKIHVESQMHTVGLTAASVGVLEEHSEVRSVSKVQVTAPEEKWPFKIGADDAVVGKAELVFRDLSQLGRRELEEIDVNVEETTLNDANVSAIAMPECVSGR